MKDAFTLCFTLAFACVAFADRPVAKGWNGQWKGNSYFVSPNSGSHLGEPWSPEKGAPPLSAPRAVAAARKALNRLVGSVDFKFSCSEVKLFGIEPEFDAWFYVITFACEESTKGGGKREAVLPFVVYFDGFVVAPWRIGNPAK